MSNNTAIIQLGYLYYPEHEHPGDPNWDPTQEPLDASCLRAVGAQQVVWDWGSRQNWERVMGLIQSQAVKTLWLLRLEDLGDTVAQVHETLEQVVNQGSQVKQVQETGSLVNLDNPQEWIPALAALPQQVKARRMRQAFAQQRLQVRPPPGSPPFGYRREADRYVLDRQQAALVKGFFEHFLLYGSLRASVRHLGQQGKPISVATAHRWLEHPVYRGDLAYKDGSIIRNTHNPILSRDEAAQIDRWLKRHRGIPPRSASSPHALSGLVICQKCRDPLRVLTVRRGSRTYTYLRCPTCRHNWSYDKTLGSVIEKVCEQLPQRIEAMRAQPWQQQVANLEAQIAQTEKLLAQLDQAVESGILDADTRQRRHHRLQTTLAHLHQQLAQQPPADLLQVMPNLGIRPFWDDLSEVERRRYFREFIRQIQLDPLGEIGIQFSFDPP